MSQEQLVEPKKAKHFDPLNHEEVIPILTKEMMESSLFSFSDL
jgi:hypothetical protein